MDMIIKIILLLVPAGLFIYFDKKMVITNKVKSKLKINHFLGLFAFMTISLLLTTLMVATLTMFLHLSSVFTYGFQTLLLGILLGLFSNIQKLLRGQGR
ncbi:hypothetical protein [Clostridium sp.]|uniref:hypothetical protein n=1 Tax=Clostridium sp. TaxID=1506 RepID=UPI001A37F4CD|nr:hypothetical protein [Clostridium sp.]MBK5235575.1 hypothetical protein [Clostridium sp.]